MKVLQRMKLKSLQKKAEKFHAAREGGEVSDKNLKAEIENFLALAKLYEANLYDKDLPKADIYALENYRAAAELNDPNAQYIVGRNLIEKAKFWLKLGEGMYGVPAHQQYAKSDFQEAMHYLEGAERAGHPLAKRLHGLIYINGWGVEPDQPRGFKLIVESIEQEQAWDKLTEILTDIGLNKPEFFTSIMSMRGQP